MKKLRNHKVSVYFPTQYLLDLEWVIALVEIWRKIFILIRKQDGKYNKSQAGIFSILFPSGSYNLLKCHKNPGQCFKFWSSCSALADIVPDMW